MFGVERETSPTQPHLIDLHTASPEGTGAITAGSWHTYGLNIPELKDAE